MPFYTWLFPESIIESSMGTPGTIVFQRSSSRPSAEMQAYLSPMPFGSFEPWQGPLTPLGMTVTEFFESYAQLNREDLPFFGMSQMHAFHLNCYHHFGTRWYVAVWGQNASGSFVDVFVHRPTWPVDLYDRYEAHIGDGNVYHQYPELWNRTNPDRFYHVCKDFFHSEKALLRCVWGR